jgi:hypothetical protein
LISQGILKGETRQKYIERKSLSPQRMRKGLLY